MDNKFVQASSSLLPACITCSFGQTKGIIFVWRKPGLPGHTFGIFRVRNSKYVQYKHFFVLHEPPRHRVPSGHCTIFACECLRACLYMHATLQSVRQRFSVGYAIKFILGLPFMGELLYASIHSSWNSTFALQPKTRKHVDVEMQIYCKLFNNVMNGANGDRLSA